MARVLIAEDDPDIRAILELYLAGDGFETSSYGNGTDALEAVHAGGIDVAILDIMMPGMDGFALTRAIREESDIPILILSARSADQEKILGLNLGADDYLGKPFNPLEVVARIHALLRRRPSPSQPAEKVRAGDLELDTSTCMLEIGGRTMSLTPTEYRIMLAFMRSPGRIFTKAQLYEAACGDEEAIPANDATMMVHISNLREKIEDDPKSPKRIVTVRGLGYKLVG